MLQCQFAFFLTLTWIPMGASSSLWGGGGRGNHDKLSFFQVIIILLCLCQIVPPTQQPTSPAHPPPSHAIYTFWIKPAFLHISAISGAEMMNCTAFSLFHQSCSWSRPWISLRDNAFHNHFNLNLSIIMIEGDRLSFTQEGRVHFSSLRVASTLSVSGNTTLTCHSAKRWTWAAAALFFFLNSLPPTPDKKIPILPKKRQSFFFLSHFLSQLCMRS